MSSPTPYESELLAPAERLVQLYATRFEAMEFEARLQLLEAAASRFGGFWLEAFHAQFNIEPIAAYGELIDQAKPVVEAIEASGIYPALALSALAREPLDASSRRSTGAYHTDFRLAHRLARLVSSRLRLGAKAIDPASGAGMLLAAVTLQLCGRDRRKLARWLAEGVYAADRSPAALRGALIALASFTADLGAIGAMRSKWLLGDSLLVESAQWNLLAPRGFDIVIGNPPWEKLKLTRHEFVKSRGHRRHYGAEFEDFDSEAFRREKGGLANYARLLVQRYPALSRGEPDLYIAFTSLFERLCKAGGVMGAIVPGGLIRSQGTEFVRRHLFDVAERISISVIENRARFFSIDSRFKFLALACTKATHGSSKRQPIVLLHERGAGQDLEQFGKARLGRDSLISVRPDSAVPEVRSKDEWRIFQKIARAGDRWGDAGDGWRVEFCREVDMTRERPKFRSKEYSAGLPIIEGRMVQQHRFGAKGHVSGSGRRALWETFSLGFARLKPQFRIDKRDLPLTCAVRTSKLRGGFCDITGQTNERSMMAALIPAGVVCGNKVPTVLFPDDPSDDRLYVWCAIMNSLAFDWMLRRIVTTTVNYFLLLSLPMPRIAKDGLPWRKLNAAARELRELDKVGHSDVVLLRAAELRAEIDAEVAVAYGLGLEDVRVILSDFPLLDRNQPALSHEHRSTITADLVLSTCARRMRKQGTLWVERANAGIAIGARAYVPSQYADDAEHVNVSYGHQ